MVEDGKERESDRVEVIEIPTPEPEADNYLVSEHLQQMPSLFARGLIYIVVLLLLTSLVYSLLSKIDIVVESRAVARPSSHKIRVIAGHTGFIEKIFISEGRNVQKGDPLFLIRSREAVTYESKVNELQKLIPLKREYYETRIASLQEELKKAEAEYRNSLKVNRIKLEQNAITLKSTESDLSYWQKEVSSLEQEFENTKKLFDKKLTSIGEFNNIKSRLERARTEVAKLMSHKDITLKEKHIIQQDLSKIETDYQSRRKILEKEIENLKIEKRSTLQSLKSELQMNEKMLMINGSDVPLKDNNYVEGQLVRAERSGTISELYFRNRGDYVRESDLLCTILPDDSPLYMDITVANKDIGLIEEGMTIKYKFDAFPYMDYGTIEGKVIWIAPSAVEAGEQGFVYNLRGSLGKTWFEDRNNRYSIKAGMTATAEIVTKKKSIFSILFKKLKGE
jgi:HlyD family secretion protein